MKQLLFSVMCSFFFLGCPKEKPPDIIIPPEPTNCEYPAGNRNFTWRLDTVAWFPSWLGGVHAFSDSDAWIMGDIVYPNGDSYSAVHWDGNSWNEKVDFLTVLMNANDVTGDDKIMVGVGYRLIAGEKAAIAEYNKATKEWKTTQFETLGDLRSIWTDGNGYFIAVGDNGMVYTKNSYSANWVYQKAPTDFGFYTVTGVNKNEIYFWAYKHFISGEEHRQIWKLRNAMWTKLFDSQDPDGIKLDLTKSDLPNNIAVFRCSINDSIKIYVIGWESYLFEGRGQDFLFKKTNLTNLGLPLRNNGREGGGITLFSPNDIWIQGSRYNNYHWNGNDFQKMILPGLPQDDIQSGSQLKVKKTQMGKIFYTSTVSPQVYVILQGIP